MESADEANLRGQAEIWKYMFSFVDSMALRCVVELRIPDIIHSHGGPMNLAQIAAAATAATAATTALIPNTSSSDMISILERIMALLVRRNIFTTSDGSGDATTLYGLTRSSRWLLRASSDDNRLTLAPMFLLGTHQQMMNPLHCLSQCVKEGGIAFRKAHGRELWDYASVNPEFNNMFNDGMGCTARIVLKAVLSEYRDGFASLGSLVDVGGGTGGSLAEIVKSHPHIKGINFDLPHVVATAPAYPGISHVGGDMFESIPIADAVFMKWIMHDWGDKDCVKILKNCRKTIPEKNGKIIIVDFVLDLEGNGLFDDIGIVFDLLMAAHTSGGKERTEKEWKKMLKEAGFLRYKIIKIPALASIIEAYPERSTH